MAELAFAGTPPDAGELSRRWHRLLEAAHRIIRVLPAEKIGKCVLIRRGEFLTVSAEEAMGALARGEILFHAGRIRGAFPRITSR